MLQSEIEASLPPKGKVGAEGSGSGGKSVVWSLLVEVSKEDTVIPHGPAVDKLAETRCEVKNTRIIQKYQVNHGQLEPKVKHSTDL